MKIKKIYLATSIISLLIGGIIYLLFRSTDLYMFKWLDSINLLSNLQSYRLIVTDFEKIIPKIVIYSIPNGLWLFSGILIIKVIWWEEIIYQRIYIIFFCIISFLSKILQLFNIVPGVFDILDLIILVIFSFLEKIINSGLPHKKWTPTIVRL